MLHYSSALPPILVAFLLTVGCMPPDVPSGEFGWSTTDDRDLVEPEKSLLIEKNYRLGRENLFFFDHETIWSVYRMNRGDYPWGGQYTIALFEKNNTPNPVEVDLRETRLEVASRMVFIRQKYGPLKAGRYLLKVAHDSNVFDQITFEVVPPGGPGSLSSYSN